MKFKNKNDLLKLYKKLKSDAEYFLGYKFGAPWLWR